MSLYRARPWRLDLIYEGAHALLHEWRRGPPSPRLQSSSEASIAANPMPCCAHGASSADRRSDVGEGVCSGRIDALSIIRDPERRPRAETSLGETRYKGGVGPVGRIYDRRPTTPIRQLVRRHDKERRAMPEQRRRRRRVQDALANGKSRLEEEVAWSAAIILNRGNLNPAQRLWSQAGRIAEQQAGVRYRGTEPVQPAVHGIAVGVQDDPADGDPGGDRTPTGSRKRSRTRSWRARWTIPPTARYRLSLRGPVSDPGRQRQPDLENYQRSRPHREGL